MSDLTDNAKSFGLGPDAPGTPAPAASAETALIRAIEQKSWRVAFALLENASESQLKTAMGKLFSIARDPVLRAQWSGSESAEAGGEFEPLFGEEASRNALRPPKNADNQDAEAFDASGEALATLFGRVASLIRLKDGLRPGNDSCAAQEFLRSAQFASAAGLRPGEQATKMAAWAAERGAAGVVERGLLSRVDWSKATDQTVARWARALSGWQSSTASKNGAGASAANDFHDSGAWGDLAGQMLAHGRLPAFQEMAGDAVRMGLRDKMDAAQYSISAAARLLRQQEKNKAGGDPNLWKTALKEAQGAQVKLGAAPLLSAMEHARQHARWHATNADRRREIAQRQTEELDWAKVNLRLGDEAVSEFAEKTVLFFVRGTGDLFLTQEGLRWAARNGGSPSEEAWVAAAESDAKILSAMLGAWPQEKPPLAALAVAGGAFNIGANGSLRALMEAHSWSAQERGAAFCKVAQSGADAQGRFDFLRQSGPLPAEAMTRALLALSARNSLGHKSETGRKMAEWAGEWIDRQGADAKGPDAEGAPLQMALKSEIWELAQTLAERGGMGPKTVSWLLAPRKHDSPELAPWKEKARAAKEADSLGRALLRDSARRQKADKKKAPEASVFEEPKKSTRRL